jgi:hypothetical protein
MPVLKLPLESMQPLDNRGGIKEPDALATVFVRVNSEGTRLEGKELNYSILESINPHAEALADKLSARLTPPSRSVTFVSRLMLARSDAGDFENTPAPTMP